MNESSQEISTAMSQLLLTSIVEAYCLPGFIPYLIVCQSSVDPERTTRVQISKMKMPSDSH